MKMFPDFFRRRKIDRTGVRFLFRDADLGQVINHRLGFHFQLAGQFVNANLSFVCHPAS